MLTFAAPTVRFSCGVNARKKSCDHSDVCAQVDVINNNVRITIPKIDLAFILASLNLSVLVLLTTKSTQEKSLSVTLAEV